MDFKSMKIEDLFSLREQLDKELNKRIPNIHVHYVLYSHSSKKKMPLQGAALEDWSKMIEIIDRSKWGKEAIVGRLLEPDRDYFVPENTIIVESKDKTLTAYRIMKTGKAELLSKPDVQKEEFMKELEKLHYGT